MDEWRELITVAQFSHLLLIACAIWAAGCLAAGGIGAARKAERPWLKALACALLAPLVWGLYALYTWTVRVDPASGYVGLHRVSVFALNLLLFVAVGGLVGWLFARIARKR